MKLGRIPFSTLRLIMCLTASRATKQICVRFRSSFKYSSSLFVSSAILARLIVFTFTDPTFRAVPPIELKYPKSSRLLFKRQQLLKEFTLLSTNRLESAHCKLCDIAHTAKSWSTNLPFCLRSEIVEPMCSL